MIPFEKYGLPEIKPYKEYIGEETNPLIFFTSKQFVDSMNKTAENEEKIIGEVEEIMKNYENEVIEKREKKFFKHNRVSKFVWFPQRGCGISLVLQ
jgi:hypothetical protein